MWPWEHAIMGYLIYSLWCHLYYRDSPGGLEAFAVVFASVLPDLIDKPLAWEFGVFESGYAIGHSILYAIPLVIVVGVLARHWNRVRAGVAFGVGYLLHLPADVLDGYLRGHGHLDVAILLWPLRRGETAGHTHGFVDQFWHHFGRYQQELLAGELSIYMQFQLAMALGAVLLWMYDGAPVLRELLTGIRVVFRRGKRRFIRA